MICPNCGKEILDYSSYCNYCGDDVVNHKVIVNQSVRNKVFAYIGYGHGITSLAMGLIPFASYVAWIYSVIGLIFSNFGLESTKAYYAKKGKKLSLIGLVVSFIVSLITIIIRDIILGNIKI